MILASIIGALLQIIVVIVPTFANVFKLVPLNATQWLYTWIISLSPILIMEIQKKLNEVKFGKKIYEYQTEIINR